MFRFMPSLRGAGICVGLPSAPAGEGQNALLRTTAEPNSVRRPSIQQECPTATPKGVTVGRGTRFGVPTVAWGV